MKLIVILFISVNAFSFAKDSLSNFNYTIEIPKGWTTQEGCTEKYCTFLAPIDTLNGNDSYLENINITVNDLPSSKYPIEKYTEFSIKYLPSVVSQFELLEKHQLTSYSSRVTYKGRKSKFNQTWRQYYIIKDSKVYIVTFAAETSKFEHYIAFVQQSLDSFRVK